MKTKEYNRVICALLFVLVVFEAAVILWMGVCDLSEPMPSIQETDIIWVDFNVTGTLRVDVPDTNCGEVPDEAWEEARRVLGEFGDYASLDLSVRDHGVLYRGNNPMRGDKNEKERR